MHMYYRTKRNDDLLALWNDDLLALLKDTHNYFHQEDRWKENVMVTLANSCHSNELFKQAAVYYEEAISARSRTVGPATAHCPTIPGRWRRSTRSSDEPKTRSMPRPVQW